MNRTWNKCGPKRTYHYSSTGLCGAGAAPAGQRSAVRVRVRAWPVRGGVGAGLEFQPAQISSTHPCMRDAWNTRDRAGAVCSAVSFRILAEMLSGPAALCGLMFLSSLVTPPVCIVMSGMVGYGLSPRSGMVSWGSCVNTEENCLFRISAFDLGSL